MAADGRRGAAPAPSLIVLAGLAIALIAPAPAGASVVEVIRDCRDGSIDGSYSARELREAERNLPSDQVEYGDCADALRQAQLDARRDRAQRNDGGGSGGSGGPGQGGTGGAAPEPGQRSQGGGAESKAEPVIPDEDLQALSQEQARAASGGPPPKLAVGGVTVSPRGAAASSLPLPVALAMVGAGLLGLVGAWHVTRRRMGGRLASLRTLGR